MAISLFSKISGFAREVVIAAKYGASTDTDAYLISITLPATVVAVAAGALATVFIPVLSERIMIKSKKAALKLISIILNMVLVLSIAFTLMGIIYAPVLVKIIAPKFSGERYELVVQLTRLIFPLSVFAGLSGAITGVLQTFGRFVAPAAVGLPYNMIIIFAALAFTDTIGIKGLAIATVIAGLSQVLIQLPSLFREGYKYEPLFDIKDDGAVKISSLIVPVIISNGVLQINTVVDRITASGLAAGSISALNYGNRLIGFVSGIFIAAISTVVYPTMSRLSAGNDMEAFKKVLLKAMNVIALIILPAATGFIVLRYPITKLLFERGAFDENATKMTGSVLFYLSFGLLGFGMRDLLNCVFYSIQDVKTPMVNGIFTLTANIVILLILVRLMGIGGLALAASLSAILGTILLISSLYRKIGDFGLEEFTGTLVKALIASTIMGFIVFMSHKLIESQNGTGTTIIQAVNLMTVIDIGGLAYLSVICLMNVKEIHEFFEYGKHILKARKTDDG